MWKCIFYVLYLEFAQMLNSIRNAWNLYYITKVHSLCIVNHCTVSYPASTCSAHPLSLSKTTTTSTIIISNKYCEPSSRALVERRHLSRHHSEVHKWLMLQDVQKRRVEVKGSATIWFFVRICWEVHLFKMGYSLWVIAILYAQKLL